jgi:hypothetical protein
MATPNIVNVTTITPNSAFVSLSTTAATSLASNDAGSATSYKINAITVANTSASAANITINVYSAAALGGTAFPIASTISVPANASLIIVDKSTSFYLLENQSIGAISGTASALVVTASWEQLS